MTVRFSHIARLLSTILLDSEWQISGWCCGRYLFSSSIRHTESGHAVQGQNRFGAANFGNGNKGIEGMKIHNAKLLNPIVDSIPTQSLDFAWKHTFHRNVNNKIYVKKLESFD